MDQDGPHGYQSCSGDRCAQLRGLPIRRAAPNTRAADSSLPRMANCAELAGWGPRLPSLPSCTTG